MSKIKEALQTISTQLDKIFKFEDVATPAPEETPAAPKEYSLADGTKVLITEIKEGGKVTTKALDGVETPVAAGDVTLADGTVLTIGEAGAITAMKAPEELTPEAQAQAMREMVQKFAAGTPEERLANIETCTKALMNYAFGWDMRRAEEEQTKTGAIAAYQTLKEKSDTELAAIKQAFAAQVNEQNKTIKELVGVIEQLMAEPSVEPIEPAKDKPGQAKKDTLSRRMAAAAE